MLSYLSQCLHGLLQPFECVLQHGAGRRYVHAHKASALPAEHLAVVESQSCAVNEESVERFMVEIESATVEPNEERSLRTQSLYLRYARLEEVKLLNVLNTHIPQVTVKLRNDSFNFLGIYV